VTVKLTATVEKVNAEVIGLDVHNPRRVSRLRSLGTTWS
jgi:hypothetical protein